MTTSKIIISAVIASAITVTSIAGIAFAWHPKGEIIKKVQNVTQSSQLADANDASSAVSANPGDTLKYVITISNTGEPNAQGHNDMTDTVLKDTLPAGVSLASNPSSRTINETIGRIKPGQSVTKEYLVTVTAESDATITNTACFTGDSEVNDSPQKGCDDAVVTVTIPETPVTPKTPETPKAPEKPVQELPKELPKTGPEAALLGALMLGSVWYVAHRYIISLRDLRNI